MSKLAINGGMPVRSTYLSYGKQWILDEDIKAVVDVLNGDFLTTGPAVKTFEEKIAEYVGAKYAVAVSNGTAALHMACFAAGFKKGDEVLVPAMTFVASANCILYQEATPVFVDIDPITYNMDLDDLESKITNKTKGVVTVDFMGQATDMDALKKITDKHNLLIIEDAAHALGTEYKGEKIGTQADLTEFSFHPVKPITTGEGGIVTTNNKELYEKMMLFRTHGITRNDELLEENHGPWYYEQHVLGYNYRLTDIQSALGLSQMNRIDEFLERRREIVSLYNSGFEKVAEIITPVEPEYSLSGWHLYIIRLNLELLSVPRKEFFLALQAENIGVNVHYAPVYFHPYFKELGYEKGICIESEKLYEEMITIPLFPKMSSEDVNDVIKAVKKVVTFYRK